MPAGSTRGRDEGGSTTNLISDNKWLGALISRSKRSAFVPVAQMSLKPWAANSPQHEGLTNFYRQIASKGRQTGGHGFAI